MNAHTASENIPSDEIAAQEAQVAADFTAVEQHSGSLSELAERLKQNPDLCPFIGSMGVAGQELIQKMLADEQSPNRGPTVAEVLAKKRAERQAAADSTETTTSVVTNTEAKRAVHESDLIVEEIFQSSLTSKIETPLAAVIDLPAERAKRDEMVQLAVAEEIAVEQQLRAARATEVDAPVSVSPSLPSIDILEPKQVWSRTTVAEETAIILDRAPVNSTSTIVEEATEIVANQLPALETIAVAPFNEEVLPFETAESADLLAAPELIDDEPSEGLAIDIGIVSGVLPAGGGDYEAKAAKDIEVSINFVDIAASGDTEATPESADPTLEPLIKELAVSVLELEPYQADHAQRLMDEVVGVAQEMQQKNEPGAEFSDEQKEQLLELCSKLLEYVEGADSEAGQKLAAIIIARVSGKKIEEQLFSTDYLATHGMREYKFFTDTPLFQNFKQAVSQAAKSLGHSALEATAA